MKPCIFMARPVFGEVLSSLRQHLDRPREQREDRWLYAGIIVIAANAGTKF